MACLAGTPEQPEVWWQQTREGELEQHDGRSCNRLQKRTDPRYCAGCVAFRGRDAWGEAHTGLSPDGQDWYALTHSEYLEWRAAQAAAEDEDDWLPTERFFRRLAGEVTSMRWLRREWYQDAGDDDNPLIEAAPREWAEYQRAWRAEHPEAARAIAHRYATSERGREKARERKRRQRERACHA